MKNKHYSIPIILVLCIMLCPVFLRLLAHPVSAETAEKVVIVLDPGHGGIDGGTDAGIRLEKVYNLIMAEYLRDELLSHGGFEVIMTRTDNELFQKFYPRAIHVVNHNADLLLSLHCNSSTYDYVNGMEALVSLIERYSARTLSDLILSKVCEATGMRNRGIFTREDTGDSLGVYYWDYEKNWDMPGARYLGKVSDYFSIHTWSAKFGTPSIILEHGYLSHSGDRELMDRDETLRSIAKAEAAALIEYYYGHTHTFPSEKEVDFPSSCTMTGTMSYRCTVCGIKTETEALPTAADAHFWRQSASAAATCTSDGFIEYTCQISHNLSSSGHGNSVHTYTEVLPKTEHSYRVVSETPEQRTESCDICGTTVVTSLLCEVHSYEATANRSPTCEEKGLTEHVCTQCGHSYTEEIPPFGHQTDDDGVCEVCGVDLTPSTEPSETNDAESSGSETNAPATAPCSHDFTKKSHTDATCEEDGISLFVCRVCGEETTETTPALGHLFGEDDSCQRCGENKDSSRRNPFELLKNPIFLAAMGIVLIQIILLAVFIARSRRGTHKSRRSTHTYKKGQ